MTATKSQKREARAKVRTEIRAGRMERKPCEVCGDARSQAHHDDYEKPLEVRFYCQKHHWAADKESGTRTGCAVFSMGDTAGLPEFLNSMADEVRQYLEEVSLG